MVVDIFNTDKNYALILADPPWKQSRGARNLSERTVVVNLWSILC